MNYATLATKETIQKTIQALSERGLHATIVDTKEEALEKIKTLIPPGASLTNGASQTLEQIGFIDYLKSGSHGWNNLHEAVIQEKDPQKQAKLRKESILADVYLGSVHAISETGEMVIASASGSQLPSIVYSSRTLILVAGAQKITPSLDEALRRLKEYVYPLEDARMKSTGAAGSVMAKVLLFQFEPAFMGRNVHVILVNEKLGF